MRMDRELEVCQQLVFKMMNVQGAIHVHIDCMKHSLQRRIALIKPFAEAFQLRASETKLYRSPRFPAKGAQLEYLLGLDLDTGDHASELSQCALAPGQADLAVAPQLILDETQVRSSTVDEGAMD